MNPSLDELIEQVASSGALSPEMLRVLRTAMDDPSQLGELQTILENLGAHEIGSGPPLKIEDFYREGTTRFELRWPLAASLPLPFEQLDHKTQFFVLFQEWTQREMAGMFALNGGQLPQSEAIFVECLQRAQQLEVGELVARSFEGLARVADKKGNRAASRDYAQKADEARAA